MEEVHIVGGMAAGLGGKSPSRALGQSPGRGPGDEVPQKLKKNVKLVFNF